MSEHDHTKGEPSAEGAPAAGENGEGKADRPAGGAKPEDYTGVDPKAPIDPDAPHLQPGG